MRSSKAWTYVAVLLLCLSWSSLLLGADDRISDPAEVTALRAIKESLIDVNNNLSNWNRGDPCTSNWTGVLCYNQTLDDGYLHVRELQLLNMNLSGTLSSELGRLSYMKILDFMWNNITGSIPMEIGNITTLELLLLNGNQLTGSLPDELGYLPNLDRIQIDQNQISGPLPKSFANLNKTKHFHMNNNSISGQIPPELARLPSLVHFLLDNNNLSGYLPPELSQMPSLLILQLDNNNFEGTTIPTSYSKMSKLLKLSLRNCSLQGPVPDLSTIPYLGYIDLSSNQLNGSIPGNKLSSNITTINLSNNNLVGPIPSNFSGLPLLQNLLIANNSLNGSVPSMLWQNRTLNATERLIFDFENNQLQNISDTSALPQNVSVWLKGNPLCSNTNLVRFCGSQSETESDQISNSTLDCPPQSCPAPYEYSRMSPVRCFCAAPLLVGYRLKSPGISYFLPYKKNFEEYLSSGLNLHLYQLDLDYFEWQKGPRLKMHFRFYPIYGANTSHTNVFNASEVRRIKGMFTGWNIPDSDVFGPYELLNFDLLGPYSDVFPTTTTSGISKGALAGIILGAIAGTVALSAIISLIIVRVHLKNYRERSKKGHPSKSSIKINGVRSFTYEEMTLATQNFNTSTEIGQGGYGRVYKGILADGTVVAIKRAQEGSLQGEKEFLTEISFLSRLHHRNLVSLVGYCDEEGEQMLVYEFMSNGTLRDQLSAKAKEPLNFASRLSIALGSSRGILYLHTEADPPVFHRDIKASNILLDHKFTAKVADFGLSRLAPVPDLEGIVPAHVSTVVKGTPGYLDPEYFLTHKLTDKSDVYSLGVVFLELLTGMLPISHGKNIVREVNISYQSGMIFSVIDGRMGSYPSDCIDKFLTLALKCCQDETDARPSMAEVVRELENIWLMMPASDTKIPEWRGSEQKEEETPPSSSSMVKQLHPNPFESSDVSGSNLVSGVIPTITPR
ncbi:probable LRR receptor-like serine/threonine-protein kinase At1g06840 isoform X2 [Mangifera indica]|nr:probable LRR receptor-like serine/threonine-protein kinase At1g06840 isoform X2 [Mangifera indica]